MKPVRPFIIIGMLLAFIGIYIQLNVFAQETAKESTTSADIVKKYKDIQEEIERLQRQLIHLSNQERTLKNQITQFESQIKVTTLQIEDTENEIAKLEKDIKLLQAQVDGLEITLEKISNIIALRAVETYQRGEVTPLQLLVAANGFETFITKYAYISYMQRYDKKVLLELQKNQNNINAKKEELEEKRNKVEDKKKKLITLQNTLNNQKAAKQKLLEITRNDEMKFQKLLEAAKSQERQLAQLIFKDGKVKYRLTIQNLTKQGTVSQGSRIGTMGNSGYPQCSTAAHLHMEIITNGVITENAVVGDVISPFAFLKSRTVSFFQNDNTINVGEFGSGGWEWPMSDPVITQMYGKTPWSSRYLSGFHSGIDMVDYNDKSIRAPAGGTLYYAKINCGSIINLAIIEHGNGIISNYLHLQ